MTPNPISLRESATLSQAAEAMKDRNIGDVLVMDDGGICGIVTDRDIVVRGIAAHKNPESASLGEICSKELITVNVDEDVDTVIQQMRERALRRVPVLQDGSPVGIISLGDLAVERDQRSALADISAAAPSH
jgi:CBS domain-containing protein